MKKIISIFLTAMFSILPLCVAAAQNHSVLREPMYNMADSFYSNITKISKNSAWAICDVNGYPLTGFNWEAMGEIVDQYIPARQGGKWGYINTSGKVVIPYQFQKADNFSDELARVLTPEGKYAYINRGGVIVFVSPFDYSFSSSDGAVCGIKSGLYGYCDSAGSIFIHPQFEMGFDFHEGLAAVKFGGKWGYISTNGYYAVKPAFTHASDFKNGYAVCALSSGYGIIDSKGRKTSAFSFDYIGECDSQGRFPAKSGSKCGYINAQGEWIMKVDYDFCYPFTEGAARVYKDGKWGYINEQGKELVAPSFADCGEYRNGRAFYSVDGMMYGFLTLDVTGSNPAQPVTPPVTVTPPAENPPQEKPPQSSVQTPSVAPNDTPVIDGGNGEIIIDLQKIDNLPMMPGENKCISLKIGSKYALKETGLKELAHTPELIGGVTMIPLRDVVEYMGGTVVWDAKSQRLNVNCNRNTISLTLGSKIAYVNGVSASVSVAPVLVNGVTMIPVRSVSLALGCDVEWIAETQNIFIRY